MTRLLTQAAALSDRDLLARLGALATREREVTTELVAHLAALDRRPSAYAAAGYGTLFDYCTRALRLSEDAACARIRVARAVLQFPVLLERLATGRLSLTTIRLLGPHLTAANHEDVLRRAEGLTRRQVDVLVAELAPQPDAPTRIEPVRHSPPPSPLPPAHASPSAGAVAADPGLAPAPASGPALPPEPRPVIQPTAPLRYRVQFTIGQEAHDALRRLQDLLAREIPDRDPGAIFGRAVTVLLAQVERAKLGHGARPRRGKSIRPGTDEAPRRRRRPKAGVRSAVSRRDRERCAFVSSSGVRCSETAFLDFHHQDPFASGGGETVENLARYCWRHNQYERERAFGPFRPSRTREPRARWGDPKKPRIRPGTDGPPAPG